LLLIDLGAPGKRLRAGRECEDCGPDETARGAPQGRGKLIADVVNMNQREEFDGHWSAEHKAGYGSYSKLTGKLCICGWIDLGT
jgi:hypothetical protein